MLGGDRVRLAVHLGEVAVHVRELLDRLHHRVADQVGERDLAAAGALEVVVDDDPVVDHQLGRDGAHAGRRRHLQRRRHVLHDGGRRAAQHLHLVAFARVRGAAGAFGLAGAFSGALLPCGACASAAGAGSWLGAGVGAGAGAGCGWRRCGAAVLPTAVRCRRCLACRWLARGSSRPGIHANWGLPTRDPRGTCDTSPRPTTRSVRMVKVSSRQLLASIPSPQASVR